MTAHADPCEHCQLTLPHEQNGEHTFEVSLRDAETSKISGCPIFKWILEPLVIDNNESKRDAYRLYCKFGTAQDRNCITEFGFRNPDDGKGRRYRRQCHLAIYEATDQKPAPVRTPDGDISRVKQKLELLKTHETCRPGSHLPTRLVQVELKGVDNWQLKLVTTNEMREKPEAYAALTYIWGGEETYITTRDNLNDRQARIEFACLSKTIQDAVRVSYGLGIPYLWVDSQCILQKPDVKQEKYDLHEALLEQADIYSKATITIAASRSLHHDDGFLDERVFKMRVQDSAKQTLTKVLLWKLSTRTEREPIYTRGWTFQEYKLLKENGLL